MRRLARTQSTAGVSLFPFLAVLLCTMGALIVVLVVIARQARLQVAEAQSLDREDDEQVESELADLQWRMGILRESREKTADQLAERQRELSHLEDHSRRLRSQLAELETAQDELRRGRGAADSSALRTQLDEIEARRVAAQAELDQFIKTDGTRRDSYAVIPYRGSNQTRRRPIYIECRRDAIVFQPEGLTLTESDFSVALGPGNPLASGLRAAREHLLLVGASNEAPGDPYPLLLVRPDGIVAYYAARAAMQSWGSDFGYELVDQDWSLEFPPTDRGLIKAMQVAIDDARQKQTLLALANPRRARPQDRPAFRASATGGGLVRDDRSSQPGSASPAGRDRYAGGGRRPSKNSPVGEGEAPWVGGGQSGTGGDGRGAGGEDSVAMNPYTAVLTGAAGNRAAGGAASAGPTGEAGDAPGGTGDHFLAHGGKGGGLATESGGSPGGAGTEIGVGESTTNRGHDPGSGRLASGRSASGHAATGDADAATQPGGNSAAATGGAPHAATQPSGSEEANRRSPTSGDAGAHNEPSAIASHPGEYGARRASGDNAQASGRGPGRWSAADAAGSAGESRGADGQRDGTTSSGSPRVARGGAAGAGGADQPGDPSSMDLNMKTSAKSIAEARGKNWGLPNAAASSVPVTRSIHIVCDSDHLAILPERRYGRDSKVIAFGEQTEDSVDELVSSVWERIDSWGIAGRGMYWRPTLTMEVEPGGQQRFADLKALLSGSGLDVKARPVVRTGPRYPRTKHPF